MRLWRRNRDTGPRPSLEEALRRLDDWTAQHEQLTAELDAELVRQKQQKGSTDDGRPRRPGRA